MRPVFDSRDTFYREPFGAVTAGTTVSFAFCPPRAWGVTSVALCVIYEFDRQSEEIPMAWAEMQGGQDTYRCALSTENRIGPVWYHFRMEGARGTTYYGCPGQLGGVGAESDTVPPAYQLTVYQRDGVTPDWYGQGVTYHIFPDRFAKKGQASVKGLVGDRRLHTVWEDVPDYLPDENGEIRNRDFFGGNVAGVLDKLPYLRDLGVTTIYFSPIFEAASNHRYDTADYRNIDPLFGTEAGFAELCRVAHRLRMRVILDGVFNHTGYDSRYFNGRGSYDTLGAHQSQDSPYYNWYEFNHWPYEYSSWWGIYTLPQVNETEASYMNFIIDGEDSVIRHWVRAGADGWRLDVADELPDEFIRRLRAAATAEKDDAVIIGEVWEDASRKISYDVRRRYFVGDELDGVTNYPFRNALLGYLLEGHAESFKAQMESLRENYPKQNFYSLMNILGTHDTPRALTVLGADPADYGTPREERAQKRLSEERRALAARRLKLGSLIQFAFPGSPCVYYGDEAGLEGFEDPFNRAGYPWGREDADLLKHYRLLGHLRGSLPEWQCGDIEYLEAQGDLLVFRRKLKSAQVIVACNRGDTAIEISVPWAEPYACDLLTGHNLPVGSGQVKLTLEPVSCVAVGRRGRVQFS